MDVKEIILNKITEKQNCAGFIEIIPAINQYLSEEKITLYKFCKNRLEINEDNVSTSKIHKNYYYWKSHHGQASVKTLTKLINRTNDANNLEDWDKILDYVNTNKREPNSEFMILDILSNHSPDEINFLKKHPATLHKLHFVFETPLYKVLPTGLYNNLCFYNSRTEIIQLPPKELISCYCKDISQEKEYYLATALVDPSSFWNNSNIIDSIKQSIVKIKGRIFVINDNEEFNQLRNIFKLMQEYDINIGWISREELDNLLNDNTSWASKLYKKYGTLDVCISSIHKDENIYISYFDMNIDTRIPDRVAYSTNKNLVQITKNFYKEIGKIAFTRERELSLPMVNKYSNPINIISTF